MVGQVQSALAWARSFQLPIVTAIVMPMFLLGCAGAWAHLDIAAKFAQIVRVGQRGDLRTHCLLTDGSKEPGQHVGLGEDQAPATRQVQDRHFPSASTDSELGTSPLCKVNQSLDEVLARGPPRTIHQGPLLSLQPQSLQNVRECTIPVKIPCRLIVTVVGLQRDEESTWPDQKPMIIGHNELFSIHWQNPETFIDCGLAAETAVKKRIGPSHAFHQNTKHFRLVKLSVPPDQGTWQGQRMLRRERSTEEQGLEEIDVCTGSIENDQQWGEQLQSELAFHLSINRSSVFLLEVTFSYTVLKLHSIDSCSEKCFKKIVADISQRKTFINKSSGQWFVSDRFLNEYFSKTLIKHLIENSIKLKELDTWKEAVKKDPKESERFIEYIDSFAVRLLASCISAGVPLDILYTLWTLKKADSNVFPPMSTPDDAFRQDERLSWHVERLKPYFLRMKAHVFKQPIRRSDGLLRITLNGPSHNRLEPQHEVIDTDTVLPIRRLNTIDTGGFARVDRVVIHEHHHNFSTNKHEKFALKVITRDAALWELCPDQEIQVLERLAKAPHPHLTPMLGSWSQDKECSILMPLADSNLDTFLQKAKPPNSFVEDTAFVQWLFAQIDGIADGLRSFHSHIGGYHHDLRLRNILVFKGDIFKISDFGTARLNDLAPSCDSEQQSYSHRTQSQLSDAGYHAPDLERYGSVGKPQDVWSLGCILLELVVWAFGINVKTFSQERREIPNKVNGAVRTAGFWYEQPGPNGSRAFLLKPCVNKMIERLREDHRMTDGFSMLLDTIQGMLRIDVRPKDGDDKKPQMASSARTKYRFDMNRAVDKLRKISERAQLNLKNRPPPSTVDFDDVSQAGTGLRMSHHGRRFSTTDLPSSPLTQDNTIPAERTSAPNAGLDLSSLAAQFSPVDKTPTAMPPHEASTLPRLGSVHDHDSVGNPVSPIDYDKIDDVRDSEPQRVWYPDTGRLSVQKEA